MQKIFYTLILVSQIYTAHSQHFRNPQGTRFSFGVEEQRTASIAHGDIDNDGDVDIIIANGRHWPDQNEVYLNNGLGGYNVSFPLGYYKSTSYAAEVADLDGDGDLDIVVGNDKAPNRLFFNDGRGSFIERGGFGNEVSNTRNVTLNDIDSDGDIDILVTNRRYTNEICLNDGNGKFGEIIHFGNDEDSTIDVEVEDVDDDGDKDLILANRDGQQNYVYLNDNMTFEEQIPYGSGKDETRAVAVADINNDGVKDLILANIGEPNVVCFGKRNDDHELHYSHILIFDDTDGRSFSIDAGDINGDGLTDIIIGNSGEQNAYFLNVDAGNNFSKHKLGNTAFDTYDIKLADINGDEKLDVIEANSRALNLYYINVIK